MPTDGGSWRALEPLPQVLAGGARPPSGSSRHLQMAQAYMIEHMKDALTLGRVAIAVGVSVRTRQAAFNARHGFGPMQWLREQRLYRVRELLCAGDGGMSITDIAMRHGFTHTGEFSKAYRRMFGETANQSRANSR